MDWGETVGLLNLFGFAISLVLFLGAAAVYLRGSKDKGTIETLTKNNTALGERVTILEAAHIADAAKIQALELSNAVLTEVVTQAEPIAAIKSKVDGLDSYVRSLGLETLNGGPQ